MIGDYLCREGLGLSGLRRVAEWGWTPAAVGRGNQIPSRDHWYFWNRCGK